MTHWDVISPFCFDLTRKVWKRSTVEGLKDYYREYVAEQVGMGGFSRAQVIWEMISCPWNPLFVLLPAQIKKFGPRKRFHSVRWNHRALDCQKVLAASGSPLCRRPAMVYHMSTHRFRCTASVCRSIIPIGLWCSARGDGRAYPGINVTIRYSTCGVLSRPAVAIWLIDDMFIRPSRSSRVSSSLDKISNWPCFTWARNMVCSAPGAWTQDETNDRHGS